MMAALRCARYVIFPGRIFDKLTCAKTKVDCHYRYFKSSVGCRCYSTSRESVMEGEIDVHTDTELMSKNELPNRTAETFVNRQMRHLPTSRSQLDLHLLKDPDQPENAKTLRVSIIGAPNSGKSTLTNKLLGWRISSTSSKVHTTRSKINAVFTEEEKQIVFLDTPGIVTPKKIKVHHLERSLLTDPHSSFNDADIVGIVVDVSVPWGRNELDKEILKALLLHREKKSVLILNKIDALKSRELLFATTRNLTNGKVGGQKDSKVIRQEVVEPTSPNKMLDRIVKKEYQSSASEDESEKLMNDLDKQNFQNYYSQLRRLSRVVENQKGYGNFEQVFMISAKEGEGVRDLRNYFLQEAKPGDWLYHSSTLTDQDPHTMAQQCVWEKIMDHLPQEVPYNVDVEIVKFSEDEYGVLRIAMDLNCYSQRHLKLILGNKGQRIKQIAEQAKQELMNAFRRDLTLMIIANFRQRKR